MQKTSKIKGNLKSLRIKLGKKKLENGLIQYKYKCLSCGRTLIFYHRAIGIKCPYCNFHFYTQEVKR